MSSFVDFIRNKRKTLLKIFLIVLVLVAISVVAYFIFRALGITDPKKLKEIIVDSKDLGILVFIILQVVSTIFLSFVPFLSMSFIIVGVALWGPTFKTFAICFSGVIISSLIMDLLGRFGGSKLVEKVIGKKEYEEGQALVNEKGIVYVPFMYLLPLFPDDAICMACGASKMNFWLHLLFILTCRGVGAATVAFGVNFIPPQVRDFSSRNPFEYIIVIITIIMGLCCILYIARKLDKFLSKKFNKKNK